MYYGSSDIQNWFSILDYCFHLVPRSYLLGITLIPCFKVVLTVALSGYVIRLS